MVPFDGENVILSHTKNTINSLKIKEDKHIMSIFLSNNKFHMSMEYLLQNYRKWREMNKWDHHREVGQPPLWATSLPKPP